MRRKASPEAELMETSLGAIANPSLDWSQGFTRSRINGNQWHSELMETNTGLTVAPPELSRKASPEAELMETSFSLSDSLFILVARLHPKPN